MQKRSGNSKLQWSLISGFGLIIIIIMSFTWFDNQNHMGRLSDIIKRSRTASEKMEVIASLIETARTRARLTNKMLHTADPFIKDEINMQLNELATKFSVLRRALIDLGLSEKEKQILSYQTEAIRPTLALQRQSAEMALSDDPELIKEAQRILIEDVYTGQGVIIDYFMELLQIQKQQINDATKNASEEHQFATRIEIFLLLLVMLVASAIATFVIRRTTGIEKALFLEKEKAEITLKSIGDAVITTDRHGNIDYLNPIAEKVTGYLTRDVTGKSITEVFRAYDEVNQRWLADCIVRFLVSGKYSLPSNDIILYTADNEKIDIALSIAPIENEHDEVMGTITTFQNITRTKTLAKQIEYQARHDPLTGLLNRREFEQKVNQILNLFSEDTSHALCVIDLDRFKIVNDSVGHTAGDELLRQLSQRIKQHLRKSDLFSRVGGDEFAILLSNTNKHNALRITENILDTVREYQFYWNRKTFRVGASIGMIEATPGVSDYEYLFHAADTACYIAKHEGRDRINVVSLDDEWLNQKRAETHWVTRINEALEKNQFVLYGQKIVDLKNKRSTIQHKEVLIRLQDEHGEIIPPMAFIPSSERYDLMPKIDEWVINNIIEILKNPNDKTIYSINLSGQSMGDIKFTQKIMEKLRYSTIDKSRLCFEITETAAIANLENAQLFLDDLQKLGCQTALDDFGSGLSSFAYLRNLNIDYLKIDGMFIKQIAEDATCKIMVESIHSISRTMKLKTIAEYVENEDIKNTLKEIGIDYAQGFYYGKPEPLPYTFNFATLEKKYGINSQATS